MGDEQKGVAGAQSRRHTVLVVLGTRPEAIKLAPVVLELRRRPEGFRTIVCSSGQHREMLQQALEVFGIEPEHSLNVMKPDQTLAGVTSGVLDGLEPVLQQERPDVVLVQGDTTTTFVASLAAYYHRIPVGHVEAGLRTNNKYSPFPEEINRRLTTHVTDFHFVPTEIARNNLLREGVCPSDIILTGNTVVDALFYIRDRLAKDPSLASDAVRNLNGDRLILVTAHRRESFGGPLRDICEAIRSLARECPDVCIIYPVHLNPNVRGPVHELLAGLPNVKLLPPLDYVSFVALMVNATILLTDSGGIQEEGPSLGKPVLVMREVSERPEGIAAGTARLVGTDPKRIIETVRTLLDDPAAYAQMVRHSNVYGDGNAARRIADYLTQVLGK